MEGTNFHQNLQKIPSIFEITAAETLDDLIYPALKRVFNYLKTSKWSTNKATPRIPIWLKRILTPEVLTWCLQYLYLQQRDASFGESFYGLQRFSDNSSTLNSLTSKQKVISATILSTLSYISVTLQQKAQQHEISSLQEYVLKALHLYKMYKAIHLLRYQVGSTKSASPIFTCLKLLLLYPLREGDTMKKKKSKVTSALFILLEIVSFSLQFSHKWYNSSYKSRNKFGNRSKNPPPPFMNTSNLPQIPDGICPLCWNTINNPTASAISGYVYCWRCIMNHLENQQTCPMTGYAMSIEDLVRIYAT